MRRVTSYPGPNQVNLLAIIYLIFGVLLCFFSRGILLGAARILGIFLIIYGLYMGILFFQGAQRNSIYLVYALPAIIIGLVLAVSPAVLVSIFPIIIGLILIVNGIIQMKQSLELKAVSMSGWGVCLIFSLILLICGLVLLLRPVQSLSWILKLAGAFLLVEGAFMLVQASMTKRYL